MAFYLRLICKMRRLYTMFISTGVIEPSLSYKLASRPLVSKLSGGRVSIKGGMTDPRYISIAKTTSPNPTVALTACEYKEVIQRLRRGSIVN